MIFCTLGPKIDGLAQKSKLLSTFIDRFDNKKTTKVFELLNKLSVEDHTIVIDYFKKQNDTNKLAAFLIESPRLSYPVLNALLKDVDSKEIKFNR